MTRPSEAGNSLSRERLHIKVAEAILDYMRNSQLKAGDKLPSERQLVQMFPAGRNTVREALQLLQTEGLVEVISGRGAFVRREPPDNGQMMLKLMKINYRDLLDIKMWLEQLVMRRAVECAADEQLDELVNRAQALNNLYARGEFSRELDRTFHEQLLVCAGSNTLSQLVISLIDELNNCSRREDGGTVWLETVPFHMDIAQALKARNLSLALAAHEYIHHYDINALNEMYVQRTEDGYE